MSFEIRTIAIDALLPADYNPRSTLRPSARRKLEASMREFGLVEPLVWNELTNRLVGGHARLAILKSLGVREVPVSVVRLSESKERALNIILNNQDAQGRYDPQKLAALLEDLQQVGELELSGFDASTMRLLTLQPADELPPLPVTNRVAVTLSMDAPTFERLSPKLDELIREYDLESHIH